MLSHEGWFAGMRGEVWSWASLNSTEQRRVRVLWVIRFGNDGLRLSASFLIACNPPEVIGIAFESG